MISCKARMIDVGEYSYTIERAAEILMLITSFTILISMMIFCISGYVAPDIIRKGTISDQSTSLFLSAAYALSLPLMSYLFSQAKQTKQYNIESSLAQAFLIWMVFMEIIRIRGDLIFIWDLRKFAEQFVRLFWVGFLVNSYAPLHGIRVSLFVLCIYFAAYVVLKAIVIYKAKESHQIGKNPKLIHKYVKRVIIQDDLKTTPMSSCDYIVMGENNREPMLKIGRVFQLSLRHDWLDTCLSFALAKMLRRRFAKLRLDEEGSRKALDFVLEGLIDYIGSNRDVRTDINDGERNPGERVFSIIKEELKFVYDFWHMKVPTYYYFGWYRILDLLSAIIVLCIGLYISYPNGLLGEPQSYMLDSCFFIDASESVPAVTDVFSRLDIYITYNLLLLACIFVPMTGWLGDITSKRWSNIESVQDFIKHTTNSERSISSSPNSLVCSLFLCIECLFLMVSCIECCAIKVFSPLKSLVKDKEPKVYSSVLDPDVETILFRMKIDVSYLARLPKCIRGKIAKSSSTIVVSTNAKEAILVSLRSSGGLLTNGEKSLEKYGMEHLNWACQPNGSTTKGILVWHIATTLFHHQETSHKEPTSQQNHNSFKEQEVALSLSSYCHYLVKSLPELLPDEVDWPEELYETVKKEILDIALFFNHKPTKKDRCNFALNSIWLESSMAGMGVMLAKQLMNCAENGTQVWKMLADIWAEMILFIAPSDNVDGHQKILNQQELITQLWALLTHAGILTTPKPTERPNHESERNTVMGDINV